jgi:hypothetical protein
MVAQNRQMTFKMSQKSGNSSQGKRSAASRVAKQNILLKKYIDDNLKELR